MGIPLRLEVQELMLSQQVHHVRFHDVPVLWMVLSHLQSRTGNYSDAYISLKFQIRQVRQASVLLQEEPEL